MYTDLHRNLSNILESAELNSAQFDSVVTKTWLILFSRLRTLTKSYLTWRSSLSMKGRVVIPDWVLLSFIYYR